MEAFFAIYGDPAVGRFVGRNRQPEPDLASAQASLERLCAVFGSRSNGLGIWAMVRSSTNEVMGSLLLKPLGDGPDMEVGWHLARRFWGNGRALKQAQQHSGTGSTPSICRRSSRSCILRTTPPGG